MNFGQHEPLSRFFYSHRLKLHYWDYGADDKPPLVMLHGSRDHARSWDRVALELRADYHVFALDLRGHGDSQWAPGALYSIAEHVLDLSALCDVAGGSPLTIVGHSLGGLIAFAYAGTFPEKVERLVAIEGLGHPLAHPTQTETPPDRLRRWIDNIREAENAEPRTYRDLNATVARMREANPQLSESMARHLTMYGVNRLADGSYVWKFDPLVRGPAPYGLDAAHAGEYHKRIDCPVLMFRGLESWDTDPKVDGRAGGLRNYRIVEVPGAGHWVHHDQLDIFLTETKRFLEQQACTDPANQRFAIR